ncbi:unnamed protein product [marine sediment metagenome]|uniref:Uncharacterized protein n=1 Tax=marine sediment metagenome TaxID=412755 RepID=X1BB88_9ZZZZ
MIDWMFIVILLLGFLFMFLGVEYYRENEKFWAWTFTIISMVTWFFLAGATLEIERPYEMFNVTSGQLETGIHVITSKTSPEQLYFFMLLGIIMFLFWTVQTFTTASDLFKKRKQKKLGFEDGKG